MSFIWYFVGIRSYSKRCRHYHKLFIRIRISTRANTHTHDEQRCFTLSICIRWHISNLFSIIFFAQFYSLFFCACSRVLFSSCWLISCVLFLLAHAEKERERERNCCRAKCTYWFQVWSYDNVCGAVCWYLYLIEPNIRCRHTNALRHHSD